MFDEEPVPDEVAEGVTVEAVDVVVDADEGLVDVVVVDAAAAEVPVVGGDVVAAAGVWDAGAVAAGVALTLVVITGRTMATLMD